MSGRLDAPSVAPSRVGFGGSRIGSFNNPATSSESLRLVQAALDLGITVLDTSNIYGQGDSERVIGRAMRGRRDAAFVVTKAGLTFSWKYRALRPLKPLLRWGLGRRRGVADKVAGQRTTAMASDWRPEAIVASLEGSLRRLRTDRVDMFLLHSPPAGVAGEIALAQALEGLRRAGKAIRIGVSCDDLATLDAALARPEYDALQLPWDVIAALGPERSGAIRARGMLVLAREVVALQPGLPPAEAIARAVAHPLVDCTLVGTSKAANLRALVAIGDRARS